MEANTQNWGCKFILTRGVREGKECGKAVCRRATKEQLCLPHYRKMWADAEQLAILQRKTETPFIPTVEINKPELQTERTVIMPDPPLEEEIAAGDIFQNEPDNDTDLEAMLEFLVGQKRKAKRELPVKTKKQRKN